MKFSVLLPVSPETSDPGTVVAVARHAESLGFEAVSAVEHTVVVSDTDSRYPYSPDGKLSLPHDLPYPDPLELLAYVAGATDSIGLSTSVLVLPNHHPVVLAKRLATLDRLSRGRLRICLGLGWMREEIEACGGVFGKRGKMADESIDLMRALWQGTGPEGVVFEGDFFRVENAHSYPKPYREAGVPLHIGGHSAAAARRAGRRGDGFQPLGLSGDDLSGAIELARSTAKEAGRDPAALEVTLGWTLPRAHEQVEWAESMGADRMLLSGSRRATNAEALMEEMADTAAALGLGR
ncbi:LLM class F420-dependent oxidoreductase [Streptomyces sp. NPDC087440]|uniref:LLM class F420-dependent oxidoreductase n=1 Tax=Streptomyces sp. NPDC087440 TaxID=3365790 RepID=UPI0037FD0F10